MKNTADKNHPDFANNGNKSFPLLHKINRADICNDTILSKAAIALPCSSHTAINDLQQEVFENHKVLCVATETYVGFHAAVDDELAIQRILSLKGRSADKGLIVLANNPRAIDGKVLDYKKIPNWLKFVFDHLDNTNLNLEQIDLTHYLASTLYNDKLQVAIKHPLYLQLLDSFLQLMSNSGAETFKNGVEAFNRVISDVSNKTTVFDSETCPNASSQAGLHSEVKHSLNVVDIGKLKSDASEFELNDYLFAKHLQPEYNSTISNLEQEQNLNNFLQNVVISSSSSIIFAQKLDISLAKLVSRLQVKYKVSPVLMQSLDVSFIRLHDKLIERLTLSSQSKKITLLDVIATRYLLPYALAIVSFWREQLFSNFYQVTRVGKLLKIVDSYFPVAKKVSLERAVIKNLNVQYELLKFADKFWTSCFNQYLKDDKEPTNLSCDEFIKISNANYDYSEINNVDCLRINNFECPDINNDRYWSKITNIVSDLDIFSDSDKVSGLENDLDVYTTTSKCNSEIIASLEQAIREFVKNSNVSLDISISNDCSYSLSRKLFNSLGVDNFEWSQILSNEFLELKKFPLVLEKIKNDLSVSSLSWQELARIVLELAFEDVIDGNYAFHDLLYYLSPSSATTYLLAAGDKCLPLVSGKHEKVAVRITAPDCSAELHQYMANNNLALVSTSANISGEPAHRDVTNVLERYSQVYQELSAYCQGDGLDRKVLTIPLLQQLSDAELLELKVNLDNNVVFSGLEQNNLSQVFPSAVVDPETDKLIRFSNWLDYANTNKDLNDVNKLVRATRLCFDLALLQLGVDIELLS